MRPSLMYAVVAAALFTPSLARAQMPANGLAVEARLGGGVVLGGVGTVVAVPSLTVGGRLIDRLQLGVGFGIFRISSPGGGMGGTNQTTFTFAPTLSVDILKAKDNRAALYGKFALPMGAEITTTRNFFVLGYDVAIGARYCPHPNFAIGVEGGLTGVFVDPNGPNGSGITTVYGALVGTFYWGK
ncbi:MAG: hypothetical protein JWN44_4409 [Myxococcales bacterium]|nr:hypothetical protein [Myxococcales bacterium]